MPKSKWSNKGVSQEGMKTRDDNKGQNWRPDDFVSYIKNEIKRFFPKDGENCVRIVEPIEVDELDYYGFHVHFHRNVGVNNGQYLCLKRMLKQPCPICELQTDELWKTDPDLAKSYYPGEGMLMWVLNPYAEAEEEQGKLLLWQCPISLAEEILAQSNKKGTSVYINVSDPETGCLVYFDRVRTGKAAYQIEYTGVQVAYDQIKPLTDEDANQRVEFSECLAVPTYDEVNDELRNTSDSQNEAEVPEEPAAEVPEEPAAEVPEEPAAEVPFIPEWLTTVCSVCGKDQFTSESGDTCENGHGGVEGITKEEWEKRNQPTPPVPPKRPARPSKPKPSVGATPDRPAGARAKSSLGKPKVDEDKVGGIKAKLRAAIAKHKKGA